MPAAGYLAIGILRRPDEVARGQPRPYSNTSPRHPRTMPRRCQSFAAAMGKMSVGVAVFGPKAKRTVYMTSTKRTRPGGAYENPPSADSSAAGKKLSSTPRRRRRGPPLVPGLPTGGLANRHRHGSVDDAALEKGALESVAACGLY